MYHLLILQKEQGTTLMLTYKTRESAGSVASIVSNAMIDALDGNTRVIDFSDDYGHAGSVLSSNVSGVMITDVQKELEVDGEKKLLGARAQAALQSRAMADPVLKLHQGGPLNG